MKTLSSAPVEVGVYRGVTVTNLEKTQLKLSKRANLKHSLVVNGTEQIETGFDFEFRFVSFNDRTDNGYVNALRADIMC